MGLYEQIRDVAKSKGYSINKLEKELGFARSSINKFNKNTPSAEKIQQIADFLKVSVDCLLNSSKEQNNSSLTKKEERDISKDVESIMAKLTSKESGPAAYDGEELSEESAALFKDELEIALRRLKLINKEKYNPNKNKK